MPPQCIYDASKPRNETGIAGGADGNKQTKTSSQAEYQEGGHGGQKAAPNCASSEIDPNRPRQRSGIGSPEEAHGSPSAYLAVTCDIRIGTSGYHYHHWRGPFYPAKTPASGMLEFYCKYFDSMELNNSFYRLPTESAFDNWREATPPNFVFAVKASRFLTHNKKLKDPENALHNLLPRVEHLGCKLGPILFQLPPKWKVNPERLEALLEILPRNHRYAFEFRELTWIKPEVDKLLTRFNAAFCIYELAGYHSPLTVTADFAYIRLHGPEAAKYQGNYGDQYLAWWSKTITEWARRLAAIYLYFDNDQAGYAAHNAITLRKMALGECAE